MGGRRKTYYLRQNSRIAEQPTICLQGLRIASERRSCAVTVCRRRIWVRTSTPISALPCGNGGAWTEALSSSLTDAATNVPIRSSSPNISATDIERRGRRHTQVAHARGRRGNVAVRRLQRASGQLVGRALPLQECQARI